MNKTFSLGEIYIFKKSGRSQDYKRTFRFMYVGRSGIFEMFCSIIDGCPQNKESFTEEQLKDYRIVAENDGKRIAG